jgi:sirohydrochlorin ferrochelatase
MVNSLESSSLHPATAVLLIAHGSRRAEANADLERLADAVRERGEYPIVEIAYLEIASPDIPTGARSCVAKGARRVLMLPYFLSAGAHVVNDLDRCQRALSAEFPGVNFSVCPPLGLHPQIVDVVLDRLAEGAAEPRVES